MSEFMLLIRNQGNPMQGLSEAEVGAHMEKWVKWMGGLGEQGKMQGGKPFSPESAAILSNGGSEVTKGFHTEANDVNVGGYVFITADSLDEAIEISKGCPATENSTATIEIRECMDMP